MNLAGRVPGGTADDFIGRHAHREELIHDVQHVFHAGIHAADVEVGGYGVGDKAILDHGNGERELEAAAAGIVKHLGIALRNRDSSLVAGSDAAELARVRDNFLKKKLALTDADSKLDAAVSAVVEKMKADHSKSRVTVYYLLAEHYKKLDLFVKTTS